MTAKGGLRTSTGELASAWVERALQPLGGAITVSYGDAERVEKIRRELLTWTLEQVTVDLHHAMFWFEGGHALANVAYRFETRAPGRARIYDVQAEGGRKLLDVEHLLGKRVAAVAAANDRRLSLTFEGDGELTIHDHPQMRSAWFYRYDPENHDAPLLWSEDDAEGDEDFLS